MVVDVADKPGDTLRAWLAQTPEEAIDPAQPIIDAHHHLLDRRPRAVLPAEARMHQRYLGDHLMEDIRSSGHRVVDTVFIECLSMYAEDEADPFRSVGEIQFVQGVAAMAASGLYGQGLRCCGGSVGALAPLLNLFCVHCKAQRQTSVVSVMLTAGMHPPLLPTPIIPPLRRKGCWVRIVSGQASPCWMIMD